MAKQKISTKKKTETIARNKVHTQFNLQDGVLSDVSIEHVYLLFMVRQGR